MFLSKIFALAVTALLTDAVFGNIRQGEPRIILGSPAQVGQIPYQVSLQKRNNNCSFCGGSLIDAKHVVTAAHCVYNKQGDTIRVWTGNLTLNNGGIYKEVKNIFVHEKYNNVTFDYDIAVLRLKSSVQFNKITSPIALASDNFPDHTNCTVSGWGDTKPKFNNGPNNLLYAPVKIINQTTCMKSYLGRNITKNMICAGDSQGHDSCQGDSGGPLACKNTTINRTFLTGIVSFGVGCGRPNYPGVYTNVTSFVSWIEEQQKRNCANLVIFNQIQVVILIAGLIQAFK